MMTMKVVIFCASAVFFLSGCQFWRVFSVPDHKKVIENLEGSKDELFIKANDWLISVFRDATSVIQYSDKEEGKIIGKYLIGGRNIPGGWGYDVRSYMKITISVRDGKARIQLTPIVLYGYNTIIPEDYFNEEKAEMEMTKLVYSFSKAMKARPEDDF